MIAILTLLLSASLIAWIDSSPGQKTPVARTNEMPAVQQRRLVTGTATLGILKLNNAQPKVFIAPRYTADIEIIAVGEPEYDEVSRQLRVSLAIRNTSQLRLKEPAAIGVHNTTQALVNLASPSRSGLTIVGPSDSTSAFESSSVVHAWKVVPQTRNPNDEWRGRTGLRPDSLSVPTTLSFRLPEGESRFEVPLVATATLRLEIAAEHPSGTPDSILIQLQDSSRAVLYPGSKRTLVSREWFWLRFDTQVSQEDRQAIIDRIDGIPAGGMDLGGVYLIQLAPETTIERLFEALQLLNGLPGVRKTTAFVFLDPVTTS